MSKKILWGLMTLSAIVVALYALGLLVVPTIRPPFIQNLFANFPEITSIHFIGGAIAIVTGAFQFSSALRRQHLSLHRLMGRFYVGAIMLSGIAGFGAGRELDWWRLCANRIWLNGHLLVSNDIQCLSSQFVRGM